MASCCPLATMNPIAPVYAATAQEFTCTTYI